MALTAGILCSANLLPSMMYGVTVLGTVFSLRTLEFAQEAAGADDQGLAFIYFAELLVQPPGGAVFDPLFFSALFLACVSSLIGMPAARPQCDGHGVAPERPSRGSGQGSPSSATAGT